MNTVDKRIAFINQEKIPPNKTKLKQEIKILKINFVCKKLKIQRNGIQAV